MDKNMTISSQDMVDIFEITRARISQLETSGVIEKAGRNEYYLIPSFRNYLRFMRNRSVQSDDGSPTDYNAERTRLTKIKADLAQYEIEQVSSKLIPSADVENAWSAMVSNAKVRLLSIPVKVASAIFASQNNMNAIRDIVQNEIVEALQELANVQVRTVNPVRVSNDSDDSDVGNKDIYATTEVDSQQMGRQKQKAVARVGGRGRAVAN